MKINNEVLSNISHDIKGILITCGFLLRILKDEQIPLSREGMIGIFEIFMGFLHKKCDEVDLAVEKANNNAQENNKDN